MAGGGSGIFGAVVAGIGSDGVGSGIFGAVVDGIGRVGAGNGILGAVAVGIGYDGAGVGSRAGGAGIKAEGADVVFAISGIPGDPTFKGQMSADGAKITGKFSQGGGTFPFELSRAADPAAKAKKALEGFDEVVAKGLALLKVPGAAIIVVKDKEVVFSKGFGFRDVENKLPMTADTILAIGSSTKAFTAFTLGTLVDQGKVEWDKPWSPEPR